VLDRSGYTPPVARTAGAEAEHMRRLGLLVALLQAILGLRVMARLAGSANGAKVRRQPEPLATPERISVLVPVLDELDRLAPCLEGLIAQGAEVAEILVIDGGSTDGTPDLVRRFAARDRRVRLIEAGPAPEGANGKAWGLQAGLARSSPEYGWLLTIDADLRSAPALARSLLDHALDQGVTALSVATRQRLSGAAEALVHPALLTTLVYRFGIPGTATADVARVQANGQCFLIRRDALCAAGGFASLLDSVCEDVTLARAVAASGRSVGFYETEDLATVEMYRDWREAWTNWTRSLPMTDRFTRGRAMPGLADLLLVQAAPLPLAMLSARFLGRRHPLTSVNLVLLACRLGVLAGTTRAYERRPWTYWLSPLLDTPAVAQLWRMSRRKRHLWRGRPLIPGERS
jgi:dolichol-phosphate mannosyltransferase